MPLYVYACPNKDIESELIAHSMFANVVVVCPSCAEIMHRVPQAFGVNIDPFTVLADWSEENMIRYKKRKRGYNAPRYSPNRVNRPEGIPGRDSNFRRRKSHVN